MIELSANIQAALQSPVPKFFLLVRIFDEEEVHINTTTHPAPIELSNGWEYQSDGILMSADPPRLTTTVDREQYKLHFADPQKVMGGLTNWVGKEIDVRVGFLDPDGVPYTDAADTIVTYAGTVDGSAYKFSTGAQGESIFQLIGSSPMADLDQSKFVYLSRDFIRSRNINDTCCDTIYSGSNTISLKWGKT